MKSSILGAAVAVTLCGSATACAQQTETGKSTDNNESKALVVYFSHTGENYAVGDISEGNTAIIAKMIADETGADIF
ncbi:MAG: flavodoxin, partial [Duncaniella sp.]|nr:flavodoxin [Duncaniella sp.]